MLTGLWIQSSIQLGQSSASDIAITWGRVSLPLDQPNYLYQQHYLPQCSPITKLQKPNDRHSLLLKQAHCKLQTKTSLLDDTDAHTFILSARFSWIRGCC